MNLVKKVRGSLNSFVGFLRPSKRTILLVVTTAIITLVVSSIIFVWLDKVMQLHFPTWGTMKTLGVEAYWNRNLENKTESINWGTMRPGSSQDVTLYIQSVSNIETTLHLSTANWNPTISQYMNLTWNYNGTAIRPGEIVEVTLTLVVSSSDEFVLYLVTNDIKQFSFDIIISTSE